MTTLKAHVLNLLNKQNASSFFFLSKDTKKNLTEKVKGELAAIISMHLYNSFNDRVTLNLTSKINEIYKTTIHLKDKIETLESDLDEETLRKYRTSALKIEGIIKGLLTI